MPGTSFTVLGTTWQITMRSTDGVTVVRSTAVGTVVNDLYQRKYLEVGRIG